MSRQQFAPRCLFVAGQWVTERLESPPRDEGIPAAHLEMLARCVFSSKRKVDYFRVTFGNSTLKPGVTGRDRCDAMLDRALIDIRGAALRLGCSERFVRRLVQERRIPFVKLAGTRVRFVDSDLDEWVQ